MTHWVILTILKFINNTDFTVTCEKNTFVLQTTRIVQCFNTFKMPLEDKNTSFKTQNYNNSEY